MNSVELRNGCPLGVPLDRHVRRRHRSGVERLRGQASPQNEPVGGAFLGVFGQLGGGQHQQGVSRA